MAFKNYEIGGNEVEKEGSEGIADIPQNRTLIVQQLTKDAPPNPELAMGLETIEAVFKHFDPVVDVSFENEQGQAVKEKFRFENVGDFSVKKMTERSPYLRNLNIDKDFYTNTTLQFRTNKVLMRAVNQPEKKENIIQVLRLLQAELEESIKEDN